MTGVYDALDDERVASWQRVHANGERTNVFVLPMGENYAAIAVDVDPVEFEPGDAEVVGYSPTETDARAHAERWMEQHPRGVADSSGGSGIVGSLLTGMQKLDQRANPRHAEDTQE